jgi:hypothetical protein
LAWQLGRRGKHSIPPHLLNDATVLPELIDPESFDRLRDLVHEMGTSGYPVNTNDLRSYTTEHEHIGEAVPIQDGKCADVFMVPSVNRTHCILPGRIDIGQHYVMTGGVEALKEATPALIGRALSFGRYIFDLSSYPVVHRLFNSERFQRAAKDICPADQQLLDPFQFNLILQVPGQTVPMHVDGVYFMGASRFQFPQWLLAVMLWSRRFESSFVHQVQVVGYLHEEYDASASAGEFYWWGADGQVNRAPPRPRSGNAVDGSKTVHAAGAYLPASGAPPIDKNADTLLVYAGERRWELQEAVRAPGAADADGTGADSTDASNATRRVVKVYDESELRISIVYRARCFADAAHAEAFHALLHAPAGTSGRMTLDGVLATLRDDLAQRGRPVPAGTPPYELAMRLLSEYVRYPLPPDAVMPYNHCALAALVQVLKPVLRMVCASV